MGLVVILYVLVGLLFTAWVAAGTDDGSQILVIAPICLLFWPVFVFGIFMFLAYSGLRSVIHRQQR